MAAAGQVTQLGLWWTFAAEREHNIVAAEEEADEPSQSPESYVSGSVTDDSSIGQTEEAEEQSMPDTDRDDAVELLDVLDDASSDTSGPVWERAHDRWQKWDEQERENLWEALATCPRHDYASLAAWLPRHSPAEVALVVGAFASCLSSLVHTMSCIAVCV
jgi:hypothetical protein